MFTIKEASFSTEPNSELDKLFSLRYKVFHSRLKWGVDAGELNQQEKDQYDVIGTKYLYVACPEKNIVGCWRIISTTTNYMLKDTFPELLGNDIPPCSPEIHELSRFAVDKDAHSLNIKPSLITKAMFKAIFDYAKSHHIKEYVTVTSIAVERIIKQNRIPCIRVGKGDVHLLGETKSIALRIPIDDRFARAVSA